MRALPTVLLLCLSGCGATGGPLGGSGQTFEFDFNNGAQGWVAGFADYPVGEEAFFELDSGLRPLPAPLDQTRTGFFITGNNYSDDLFMYLKGRLAELKPNTRYSVQFRVEFATNAPQGCVGVGGPPGEGVFVKAGATVIEPDRVVMQTGLQPYYVMNIDKGGQAQGGKDAIVLGNIANSQTDCFNPSYEIKVLQNTAGTFSVRTDASGRLWLIVGTDSGFEGKTSLYYTKIRTTLWEE